MTPPFSITCPRLGVQEREILLAFNEWYWRRFRLTRPCIDAPDGPSLGLAISDALHAMDGSALAAYPHESRDSLFSLLSEGLPLMAIEREAVRALIEAADAAIRILSVEYRRALFLLAVTSREEGTGRLAQHIHTALEFVDGAPPGRVGKIKEACEALTRRSKNSPAIAALITAVRAAEVLASAQTDTVPSNPDIDLGPSSGHPRSAPRRALRLALALARDALTSPSAKFRGTVQDAIAELLDAPTTGEGIDDDATGEDTDRKVTTSVLSRLAEVRQITRALTAPNILRCALCEEAMSPGEGSLVPVDNGHVATHDDLAHCVLSDLSLQLRRWVAAHPFDDDQDPARDTPAQRLVRAYHRFATLLGDADGACLMKVSCDACATIGYSNTDCWACRAHWQWMAPGLRRAMVSALINCPTSMSGNKEHAP